MYEFPKKERLCSKVDIDNLFAKGACFLFFPLSVRYIIKNDNTHHEGVRVLLLCPKKYQKTSVARNRIKRVLKETYRLNKHSLVSLAQEYNISITFSISFVSKDTNDEISISAIMQRILETIQGKIIEK